MVKMSSIIHGMSLTFDHDVPYVVGAVSNLLSLARGL